MCICPKFDITRSAMQDLARCRLVVPDMTWDKLKPDCYVVVEASSRFGHAIPGIFVYPNVYHDLDCAESFVTFAMAWDFEEVRDTEFPLPYLSDYEIWHVVDEKDSKITLYLEQLSDSISSGFPLHYVFACFDDTTGDLLWERYFDDDSSLFRFARLYDDGDNTRCLFCTKESVDCTVIIAYISTKIPSTFDALQQLRIAGGVCRG